MDNSKFDPGTAVAPTSTIEIAISCRNLLDKDFLSKSDPMCVVYHRPLGAKKWIELMRTEHIQDNLNPDFGRKVTLEYHFEEQQPLRFEIYDIDSASHNLAEHDFLGCAETTVGLVVSSGTAGLSLPLSQNPNLAVQGNARTHGTIILLAEELSSLKDEVVLHFGGNSVGSVACCFFASSVFFVLYKVNESQKYVVVHRSEIKYAPDPTWQPITIPVRSLCNGDKERGLKIECFESNSLTGNHSLIGSCSTNLNHLMSLGNGGAIKLVKADGVETSSNLLILQCKLHPIYTFVDYIQNGTNIHCSFAIDFTSSNGDPSDPSSLHHFSGPTHQNPYEQAIQSVGNIIQDYDAAKMFPVQGFGARIPPHGQTSHNFPVTLSQSPFCYGIEGVMEAYRNCIRQIQMYGPTNFSPIINNVAQMAAQYQSTGDHYYVLVIITDGIITDMPNTKEAIVNASTLPLSIIIIGVGGADFEAMEELDGDSVRLSANGRYAARDIVQFVPYRDAQSWMNSTVGPGISNRNAYGGTPYAMPMPYGSMSNPPPNDATHRMAQAKLAQEVLQEIPDQLTSFMKSKGISPRK